MSHSFLSRLRRNTVRQLLRKALRRASLGVSAQGVRIQSYLGPTYCTQDGEGGLVSYLDRAQLTRCALDPLLLKERAQAACDHKFDLLGSGPVIVKFPTEVRGFVGLNRRIKRDPNGKSHLVNHANRTLSRAISRLADPEFENIDWQLDFKSGYRWKESVWSRDIRFGVHFGADVKVPWELARMQHLPGLGLAALYFPGDSAQYAGEFRNQVVDFIAHNPPGFGINWVTPMDIAIRISNILIAWDVFRASGVSFESDFMSVLERSVIDHGRYILRFLEWNESFRGNHYLSNLAGLLFCGAYLRPSKEGNSWIAFALPELVNEVEAQFLADGGNAEASTSYHLLSTEIAIVATAMALRVLRERPEALESMTSNPHDARLAESADGSPGTEEPWDRLPFSRKYFDRLRAAVHFAAAIRHPGGLVPQFGDNDSGRFLRVLDAQSDGQWLLSELAGVLETEEHAESWEGQIVRSLARFPVSAEPIAQSDAADLQPAMFPDFGMCVFRRPSIFLVVRYGPVGQQGNGGHAHNDQGSFELSLYGRRIIVDPGTFVYSADAEARNHFRSTGMHNVLHLVGHEQNDWLQGSPGLFSLLEDRSRGRVLRVSETGLEGIHYGFGVPHRREFRLQDKAIVVRDRLEAAGPKRVIVHLDPELESVEVDGDGLCTLKTPECRAIVRSTAGCWQLQSSLFSPAYGRLLPSRKLTLDTDSTDITWSIHFEDQ